MVVQIQGIVFNYENQSVRYFEPVVFTLQKNKKSSKKKKVCSNPVPIRLLSSVMR